MKRLRRRLAYLILDHEAKREVTAALWRLDLEDKLDRNVPASQRECGRILRHMGGIYQEPKP